MKVLLLGDIIGKIGRNAVKANLDRLIDEHKIDFVIANGENLAGGFGLTKETSDQMFKAGIDVLTSGNHIWDKKEALNLVNENPNILRPQNYPPKHVPGKGAMVYEKNGFKVGVINLIGRVYMDFYDDPFRCVDDQIAWMKHETNLIFIDFHGEASSEKQAMGWHVDGQVTGLVGTHTHVQTADERILPSGTAYITDLGMSGPLDSVIGLQKDEALKRFYTRIPHRFMEVPKGEAIVCGVAIEADESTGKAVSITRIRHHYPEHSAH